MGCKGGRTGKCENLEKDGNKAKTKIRAEHWLQLNGN